MNIKQHILMNRAENDFGLELSILSGKDTLLLPSKLSKTAIELLFQAYQGLSLSDWEIFYPRISELKFERLVDEIPEPDESEGIITELPLEYGGKVVFLARFMMETSEVVQ